MSTVPLLQLHQAEVELVIAIMLEKWPDDLMVVGAELATFVENIDFVVGLVCGQDPQVVMCNCSRREYAILDDTALTVSRRKLCQMDSCSLDTNTASGFCPRTRLC